MALQTNILRKNLSVRIKAALDTPITENSDPNEVKKNIADDIANTIADELDTWIKTAEVTVKPGISVSTAGSPTAQTGATTSTGSGTIL